MVGFGAVGEAAVGALPDWMIEEDIRNQPNLPTLSIAGLIIPDSDVAEGLLVKSYATVWLEVARRLGADWSLAHELNARDWEEMIAGAFHKDGYRVTLTPRSGDGGRDVIAESNGIGCVRILGSVKAYKPMNLVTRAHVHEMLGVVSTDLRATKAIIATTSDFAPRLLADPGIAQAIPFKVELINGVELQKWLRELSA